MWAGLNPLADPVWPTGRIFGNPALNQIRECVCEEHKHMYCISGTGILKQADWHFQRMGLWELILVAQLVLNFFCNLHFFFSVSFFCWWKRVGRIQPRATAWQEESQHWAVTFPLAISHLICFLWLLRRWPPDLSQKKWCFLSLGACLWPPFPRELGWTSGVFYLYPTSA